MLVMIAAAALLFFGTYARRVELHGMVLPAAGLIQVSSPVAGWVEFIKVKDGRLSPGRNSPLCREQRHRHQ